MKTRRLAYLLIALIGICTLVSVTTDQEGKFYYAFAEKTPLIPKENTLLVKFTKEFDREIMENFLKETVTGIKIIWHNPFVAELSTDSFRALEDLKLKLKYQENISSCQPFYKSEDGLDMGVTDEILIRFLPGVSEKHQEELHNKFETVVIKKTKIYQKLICPRGSDALDIANTYFETGLLEFSTPDFISYAEFYQTIPNDTYFNNQVTCHNTGQTFNDGHSGTNDADIDAPEAWEICTGSNNIVIAVLDQGVTSNHPDLPNTRQVRLSGSDFTGNDDNPSPVGNENHGNACAGVIAATMNNNEGIAGIAPNCKIMPIRMTGVVPSIVADAIEFAVDNGADILTNSWGYNSSDPNLHPVIVAAIQYAINNNCVVIFAAGNSARRSYDYNGYVSFPSNVNIPGVITVGASDRDDHQSDYSPSSDPESVNNQIIDIVAPSHRAYPPEAYLPPLLGGIPGETFEMWSIDIPGNTGYNPWPTGIFSPPSIGEQLPNSGTNYLDYTGRFGGTSHSCPVVAGVAALVLSINPNLTNLEVYDILTSTTDEVGGYTYENGWSEELGHGRVNAYSAVCETYNRSMYISGPPEICESGATFTIHNRPPGSTVVWRKSKPLIYVSGQGTDNYTVSAYSNDDRYNGTIISTITTSWGQVVCEKKSWVGRPGLPVTTPDGDPPIEVLYGSSFLVRIWDPPGADPSTGSWLSNGSISIRPGWGTGRDCIFDATGYDYGQWNVNTTNACGISDTYTGSVIVPGGGWDFTMFPNPANSYVEIHAEKNERYVEGTTSDTYEAVLYNSLMSLVYKSIETDKPILNINTSSFINGTYFLYITAGKQVEVFQLVVKH